MTKFYKLRQPSNYQDLYANPYSENVFKPRCRSCKRPPIDPVVSVGVRFEGSLKIADFVFSPPELLVVDEVKRAFERDGINVKYDDVTVRITGTEEKLRSRLWHIRDGRAHAAPEMNIVAVERCPACGVANYSTWDNGVVVDESRWDGSDIFRLYEDIVGRIATEKVRDVVEREGFTGVEFIPAEEFTDPWEKTRPERPS